LGQEILYCNKCGKRLVGDDFTRGRAHTFNHKQYCTKCLPQDISTGMHKAIKAEKKQTERRTATGRRTAAARPGTTRANLPAAPKKSPALLLSGIAIGAALLIVVFIVVSSSNAVPAAPEPVSGNKGVAPAGKSEAPRPAPAPVSKEKIAQELKDLDAKIQPTLKVEQFGAVTDLLEEARKRIASPDWDQAIQKRIQEVRDAATALYGTLKEQASTAQLRGAIAEAQQQRTRLAGWGRKDLLDDLDKTLAAVIPHEPLPPGATVLARFPDGDKSKYYYRGDLKNGAIVGLLMNGSKTVGMESGREIFKVPSEGEVRVVYSTNSTKPIDVHIRAFSPEGKNIAYRIGVDAPVAGRPQVLKFPISQLKSWVGVPISVGSVVDNAYFMQSDPQALMTVYEFVIFKTKD